MKTNAWIFQANPLRYNIYDAIKDANLDNKHWLVNQCKDFIRKGDTCLIWMSGKNAGIYAVGEVLTDPEYSMDSDNETDYWQYEGDKNKRRLRVKFTYKTKIADTPVLRSEIMKIPELKQLSILRQAQGTNFPVTSEEWLVISKLIEQKDSQNKKVDN